jgi:RNA polymerase sigma factor (sigma-70 family)
MVTSAASLRGTHERNDLVLRWRYLPRRVVRDLLRRRPDARRLLGRLDFEDLEQVGLLGLMRAAERWDPTRNAKFSTFAFHCVRNRLCQELRRQSYSGPGESPLTWEPTTVVMPEQWTESLAAAMARLDAADRQLLEQRFGLRDEAPRTIVSIAREWGRPRKYVRKCLVRALNRLSAHLGLLG